LKKSEASAAIEGNESFESTVVSRGDIRLRKSLFLIWISDLYFRRSY